MMALEGSMFGFCSTINPENFVRYDRTDRAFSHRLAFGEFDDTFGWKMLMVVNNITRLLDARKIPYVAFELPAEKLGAAETARLLNVSLDQVFKTIVVTREGKGKPILAVISGAYEVDLKLLAKVLDEKKLHLPTEREAEQLTGLQAGGISPLALINKGFQVVLDSYAEAFREIHISGGKRGLNIRLPVDALVNLTNARVEAISRIL
jgi:Cys-tRNA(Pro)/Cys-tRNA(Cys) deacylase